MKWPVQNNKTLQGIPTRWNIDIPHVTEGNVLRIVKGESERVKITLSAGQLDAAVTFDAHPEAPVRLQGRAAAGDAVLICNTENRIALYVNGQLQDEDWPLGVADLNGATCFSTSRSAAIHDDFSFDDRCRTTATGETVHDITSWLPPGHNTCIGDCMPFAHAGSYRLFFLFDRRHHQSKWHLGAHQWGQIVTRDFSTWQACPLAITIDQQEEGSICTGSVIFSHDLYYAFYAVRMSDRSPARLSFATSTDGLCFQKSNRFIHLQAPYEPVSARDPKVFYGADGQYHMLVTTSLAGQGCLAHLVSGDLTHWSQQSPFLVLDMKDHPECPDYFFYHDFYYLVYSNYGIARYFFSRDPFGPWQTPDDPVVGHEKLRVPKAAILNGRLVFAGFVAKENTYGGHFSLYEAQNHIDGRLTFSPLRAPAPSPGTPGCAASASSARNFNLLRKRI